MDPVTVGAVFLAAVTGVSEVLGGHVWDGLVSLVRRPSRGKKDSGGSAAAVSSGEAELLALQQSPDDHKAVALAEVLLGRAESDTDFGQALRQWWAQAAPIRDKIDDATNTISGGTQYGPVLQGRDFTNLAFGVTPAQVALPKDPNVGQ